MSESSRQAIVVPVQLLKHSNADSLSIVLIGGFQCVVNTAQWEGITQAFYLEPETVVDVRRPEFAFLKRQDKERDKEVIRARRIRGEWSLGLLIPAPSNFNIGDDGWEYLGLEHYEPVEDVEGLKSGDCIKGPPYWANLPKYDLENWKKYKYLLQDGEHVIISQKINGSNMSCVYSDGEYHVKSRNLWKKDGTGSDFWRALHENEPLKKYLKDNENHLVQGELTGKVGGFPYGVKGIKFYAFDIRKPDYHYMDGKEFMQTCLDNGIETPRVFALNEPYSEELALKYVDGEQWNNPKGIREGVVIRPSTERYETKLNGRLVLKLVSNIYLEKQK